MTSTNGLNTFTYLKLVHDNLSCLCSSNDLKYEVMDQNRVPYAIKFSRDIENLFAVSDENGFVKLFQTVPNFKPIKEFKLQRSCIYDLQWLNRNQIVCGGGDKCVSVFDLNIGQQVALMKGHNESVKSISVVPNNQFVLASGSRDGSILIYDLRCNKQQQQQQLMTIGDEMEVDECSLIKPINNILKAHYDQTAQPSQSSPRAARSNKLASAAAAAANVTTSLLSASFNSRRATPVASIAFQSEHHIVSAGAADGLIKVWDTRKIYSPTHQTNMSKFEPALPLLNFYAPLATTNDSSINLPLNKISSKSSFSNILFNQSHTKLYGNCLNNSIYEFNFTTYKQKHTRALNNPVFDFDDICNGESDQHRKISVTRAHHLNSSNFIRSCLSPCDNYLLTGSSDSNAYIYSTNVNADLRHFRNQMPVIVLRGHNNEVTAVDWSQLDLNQIVTCSDDNTIRLWNVKRNLDVDEKSNECNFLRADVCFDKYESYLDAQHEGGEQEQLEVVEHHQIDRNSVTKNDLENFIPAISCVNNPRLNNHRPHYVTLSDDAIFTNYEYKRFFIGNQLKIKQHLPSQDSNDLNNANVDLANLPINIRVKTSNNFNKLTKDQRPSSKLSNWPIGFLAVKNDQDKVNNTEPKNLKIVSKRTKKTLIEEDEDDSENLISHGSILAKSPIAKRRNVEKMSKSTIKKPTKSKRTFLNSTNLSMSATKLSLNRKANTNRTFNLFMNLNDLKKPLDLIENNLNEISESSENSSSSYQPKSKKRLNMTSSSSIVDSSHQSSLENSQSSQQQHQKLSQSSSNNRSILDYFLSKQ